MYFVLFQCQFIICWFWNCIIHVKTIFSIKRQHSSIAVQTVTRITKKKKPIQNKCPFMYEKIALRSFSKNYFPPSIMSSSSSFISIDDFSTVFLFFNVSFHKWYLNGIKGSPVTQFKSLQMMSYSVICLIYVSNVPKLRKHLFNVDTPE